MAMDYTDTEVLYMVLVNTEICSWGGNNHMATSVKSNYYLLWVWKEPIPVTKTNPKFNMQNCFWFRVC